VGREMYRRYERRGWPVHEIGVSLVSEKDIEETLGAISLELHKPLRLLSIGRLDAEKGLRFLIEALELLIREKRLDANLRIVGKSHKNGEEQRLRGEVERRQLSKFVHFDGYVSHGSRLLKLYRDSDIFVLPSLTGEGVPQTLFEAMACGIPVIATRVAGIPFLIQNGENGLLTNPNSSGEIAEAIRRVVSDSELRSRLVTNGLATAKRHTLEVERDKVIRCIERFLKHRD
jgi:glycosyltransferase involved in cell wall biosynthesis